MFNTYSQCRERRKEVIICINGNTTNWKTRCFNKLANIFLILYLCIIFICTQAVLPFNFKDYVFESSKLFYD